jgi:uncharacterized integral membrane protein
LRRLSWIITLPITVLAVLFALSNSATVEVRMEPLPWAAELPVYLLILGCLLIGFLLGAIVAWFSGSARRRRLRALSAQVRAQADEIATLRAEAVRPSPAASGSGGTVVATLPRAG